jgi:hypothetical protein
MRTGAVEAAARPMSFQIASMAALVPTRSWRASSGSGAGPTSRASARWLSARSMAARKISRSNGLVR